MSEYLAKKNNLYSALDAMCSLIDKSLVCKITDKALMSLD